MMEEWVLRVELQKEKKEVFKRRADMLFRLKQGEFITLQMERIKKVQSKWPEIKKDLPEKRVQFSEAESQSNFVRVYQEARALFKG